MAVPRRFRPDNRILAGFLYGTAVSVAIVALLRGYMGLALLLIVVAGWIYAA